MFLARIDIANFRGIRNLSIELDQTTVLIGENNTGKSAILAALDVCLNRNLNRRGGAFAEYDHHLSTGDSDPVESDPIEVTLRFGGPLDEEWPPEIAQVLATAIQVDEHGNDSIVFRVRSGFDEMLGDFNTTWNFLDIEGNELPNTKINAYLFALQQLSPVFYLSALRDSAQEFRRNGQFWAPFVRSQKMDPDLREELEAELADLNRRVLEANDSFEEVERRLANTGKAVPLAADNPVGIEAIPGRVFDILGRTQVMLTSVTGARIPMSAHGEGTQSLAVICLFDAFLRSKLEDTYRQHTTPILALEEPESHLHPSATHSVVDLLREMPGQQIISTHSGDLVAACPLPSLRRLRWKDGEIASFRLQPGDLNDDELRKIDHHIRSSRGSFLFARCWLLVEGEADRSIFEGSARVLGRDLVREGISCVEYRHIGIGVDVLTKFADCMGIDWFVVADDDSAGDEYVRSARRQIGARTEAQHIRKLAHGDLEMFLCTEGYGCIYEGNVSPQKRAGIQAAQGTTLYWEQVIEAQRNDYKTRCARAVVDEMDKSGSPGVPLQLKEIIETSIRLAKEN